MTERHINEQECPGSLEHSSFRDGGTSFAYARIISNFGAGQFDNLWQPQSTGTVTRGFVRSFIGLGADAAYDLMQEFIPFTRPHYFRHGHLEKQP